MAGFWISSRSLLAILFQRDDAPFQVAPALLGQYADKLGGMREIGCRRNLKVDGVSASADADRGFVLSVHV
jgi:hypothetical protein